MGKPSPLALREPLQASGHLPSLPAPVLGRRGLSGPWGVQAFVSSARGPPPPPAGLAASLLREQWALVPPVSGCCALHGLHPALASQEGVMGSGVP